MASHFFKGGATRSKSDRRDYQAEAIIHAGRLAGASQYSRSVPREHFLFDKRQQEHLLIGGNAVYNQGSSFKCVAFSLATILEQQIARQKDESSSTTTGTYDDAGVMSLKSPTVEGWKPWEEKIITISKDYIYNHRENGVTDGMSGADGVRIISKYGCVEEKDYDRYLDLENRITVLERQTRNAGGSAGGSLSTLLHQLQDEMSKLAYRIKGSSRPNDVYAKVTTVQGLKESLFYNGPCLIILPFFNNPQHTDFWNVPHGMDGKDEMGHAVTIVGYSDDHQAFYLRNTWGPDWNGTGHVWFPYSSLHLAWEIWTLFLNGTEHVNYHLNQQASYGIQNASATSYYGAPKSILRPPPISIGRAGAGDPAAEAVAVAVPAAPAYQKMDAYQQVATMPAHNITTYPAYGILHPHYQPPPISRSSGPKSKEKKADKTIATIQSVLADDKCKKFLKALLDKFLEAEQAKVSTQQPYLKAQAIRPNGPPTPVGTIGHKGATGRGKHRH
jgi:hypothetical protein